ncbi:MAG: phosphotransferase [Deltaproteobacteria bacterium]|nr:phosphotransferase [Deltaproteobacteria bacterium]
MDMRGFVKSYIEETYPLRGEFTWERLPSDGSKRAFYRLSDEQGSFIVMEYPPLERTAEKENLSYLKIGEHLLSKGIPVARIFRYNLEHGWFIMEDLGKVNLQEMALNSGNRMDIYKRVLELLVKLQIEGREDFNPEWCFHTRCYDRFLMEKHESEYFLTYFLKGLLGMEVDLAALKSTFTHLSQKASLADNDFFLHRDFQSRNLIIRGDKIGIVDWQGGRLGPLQYDLASLLIDPYVGLTTEEKILLYERYITLIEKRLSGISGSFIRYYPYLAIQRNLQILGAFSYLGNVQGKKWFLGYIPPALESLEGLLEERDDPELHQLKTLIKKINGVSIEAQGDHQSDG